MPLSENKRLARVWFDEVMNGRDLDAIDRTYAVDYTYHGPHGTTSRGLDEAKAIAERLIAAVPDRVSTVEVQVAEDDLVVTRWVSRGTQTGRLLGRPPTNKPIEVHGITISRIADGRIAEDWEVLQVADM